MAVLGENMDFDSLNTFSYSYRSGDVVLPNIKWIEPLESEINHFYDCIQNKTDCLSGPSSAAKVVKILHLSNEEQVKASLNIEEIASTGDLSAASIICFLLRFN